MSEIDGFKQEDAFPILNDDIIQGLVLTHSSKEVNGYRLETDEVIFECKADIM